MMYTCIVVDDEPLAVDKLAAFISKVPTLKLLSTFDNALNAIAFLQQNQVDLLFLDIQMDELTGIQMLETFKVHSRVILTTAYSEYALKGYELNITDYLLKPFSFERFLQAVNKIIAQINETPKQQNSNYIFVKTDYKIVKIMCDDILYIEGMRDYRCIHTPKAKILTPYTFTQLEEMLPATSFVRIHKSFMVSLAKIESVERHRVKINNELLPVSDSYKDRFYSLISR